MHATNQKILHLSPIIAHRGASAYAPENTRIAMLKAYELHAGWVEFDVRLSADGVPICFHDATVDRVTDGLGRIVELSWQSLQQLDAGSWFANEFAGERIASFSEIIKLLGPLGVGMNIEIKPNSGHTIQTARAVVELLDKEYEPTWPTPLISSFELEATQWVHQQRPHLFTGLLLDTWDEEWQKKADSINAASVHLVRPLITQERVDAIHATGRKVLTYTINSPDDAYHLLDLGVDALFSDYPDLLQQSS